MSFLNKVDHITCACAKGTIEKWAWFHIDVEGGKLVTRIDDVRPDDPGSSMKLWCIDYGEFGIALVEGIDRQQKSQVTKFVERQGDHSGQHVAYDCHDLERFRRRLIELGGHVRGPFVTRHAGFGKLKQMVAKGYADGDAAEVSFPEYVERPRGEGRAVSITFSEQAGRDFYEQIEQAIEREDDEPLVDFSRMPKDCGPSLPAHGPAREERARWGVR